MKSRAHVVVVRDGKILVLQQAGVRPWWEQPGGDVEREAFPEEAVTRQTLEETGLRIASPALLREWSYLDTRGESIHCYAYVADPPSGDMGLSDEHTAFAWMNRRYADRYCNERIDVVAPQYANFMSGMRENCALFRDWLKLASKLQPKNAR